MDQEDLDELRTKLIPTWVRLRAIGNSRAVQASAAFPLIGYLVLLSTQVTSIFDGGLAGPPRHDVDWFTYLWSLKLYFVYFGLLQLGIGSVLYQLRCPRQIKKHGDWEDYVRIDGPSMPIDYVAEVGMTMGRNFERDFQRPGAREHFLKIDYLRQYYAVLSAQAPFSRLVVSYLFLFGLSLLSIPSLMTALKVSKLLWAS